MTRRSDVWSLGRRCHVTVDRSLCSAHRRFTDLRYPVNFGYIDWSRPGDGLEFDACTLRVDEPIEAYTGLLMPVIHQKDDFEDKLVVARSPNWRRINCQETDFSKRSRFWSSSRRVQVRFGPRVCEEYDVAAGHDGLLRPSDRLSSLGIATLRPDVLR
mgnify:CR=1 FL=1